MRTPTQIFPITLPINADLFTCWNAGNDFGFIGFANVFEMGDGFVARPHFAHNGFVAFNNVAHPRFYFFKIIGAEGRGAGEVVKKAVFNHGSYRHLRIGEQLLHRLCQHMGAIMAQ